MSLVSVSFHQSYPRFVGIYAFHGQHKPPSPPQQRIFLLIFIATIREIFCLSPLLVMRIWCQFFPSWKPFDHSNFSLKLQSHSIIKSDWSDPALRSELPLYTINGFRNYRCNIRPSTCCPCLLSDSFLTRNVFERRPLDRLEITALSGCELKWFPRAFCAGTPSPLACLP